MRNGSPGGRPAHRTASAEPTDPPPEQLDHLSPHKMQARRQEAARHVTDPEVEAVLDALVDAAPPLDNEARVRLAQLLRGRVTGSHRSDAA
jgi:hypothetical protein